MSHDVVQLSSNFWVSGICQRIEVDLVVGARPVVPHPPVDGPDVRPVRQGGADVVRSHVPDVDEGPQVLVDGRIPLRRQVLLKRLLGRRVDPGADHGDGDAVRLTVLERQPHAFAMCQLAFDHRLLPQTPRVLSGQRILCN